MSDSVIVTIGAPDNQTAVSVSSADRIFVDIAAGFTGQGGGGGGDTNLSTTRTATTVTVVSSTGTDATIPAADGTNAGVMTAAMQTKLAGIEAGAEVNDTASEILTKLLTVDGTGSNLDADTLDGVHASALVPYTGATGDVNLGEHAIKAGQIDLDTSPTGTATVGTTRWNDTIGSSETTLKGGNVILKNGVDLVARVVNKVTPNTTLTKAAYQAVRVSGAQGQRLAVALAQANNDNNSADTIGLVTETIATNQEGFIMTVGQLEGINTTGSLQGETWVDGDVIYLSPTTAGALTNVKPVAPNHIVIIGYVEYAHANNGKLYVKVMNGWELGELHDVDTTESKTTPVDADAVLLQDSADSSIWKRLTWANLKATAKTYFDTLYVAGNTAITGATKTKITYDSKGLVTAGADAAIADITGLQTALDGKVDENAAITPATKTKVTYDAKGLVTAGADATTADIADSLNKRYVTDAQLTVIGNTSGTNTGDQTITLTGDVTGSGTGSFAASIDKTAIAGKTTVTAATGDLVLIADASDSNNLKKVTVDTIAALAGGGSISDGDKGDITVSSSGTVWTVDNDAITYAKLQNVSAASKLLGRGSASGSGDVEEITLGTGLSMSGTTLSATGGGGGGDLTTLYESYTQTGPVNSTTETAVFSYALPTDLVAGDMIEVDMVGTAKNNSGGTRTFDIKWKLGATTILNHNIGFTASATERTFSSKFRVYIVNPSNSQKAGVFGMGRDAAPGTFLSPSTGEHPFNGTGYGTAAEDLTSAKTLQATVRFLVANADLYIYCQAVKITKIAAA
jgi:hypothetical protein